MYNSAKKGKVTRNDTEDMSYDNEDTSEDDNQESDDSGASMGSSENDVSEDDEDLSEDDDDDARAKRNIEIEGDLLPEEKEVYVGHCHLQERANVRIHPSLESSIVLLFSS